MKLLLLLGVTSEINEKVVHDLLLRLLMALMGFFHHLNKERLASKLSDREMEKLEGAGGRNHLFPSLSVKQNLLYNGWSA